MQREGDEMATAHLSHGKPKEGKAPKKEVHKVEVQKVKKAGGKGHSFRITNHHTSPAHPPEEFNAENMAGVNSHMASAMGPGGAGGGAAGGGPDSAEEDQEKAVGEA